MSTSLSIKDTSLLFFNLLEYNIYRVLIFLGFIFVYILINKKDNKIIKYIITIINTIVIGFICAYYLDDILTLKFSNLFNNIYVYFLSNIVFLLIFSITMYKLKYKNIYYILYVTILINILFSLFMTLYLKDNTLLVLGNIYPMMKINNIVFVLYYVLLTIKVIRAIINSTFKGVK